MVDEAIVVAASQVAPVDMGMLRAPARHVWRPRALHRLSIAPAAPEAGGGAGAGTASAVRRVAQTSAPPAAPPARTPEEQAEYEARTWARVMNGLMVNRW